MNNDNVYSIVILIQPSFITTSSFPQAFQQQAHRCLHPTFCLAAESKAELPVFEVSAYFIRLLFSSSGLWDADHSNHAKFIIAL